MAFYKYRSVDQNGRYVKGNLEALDKDGVIYLIKQKGLIPLEVSIDNGIFRFLKEARYNKVPIRDLAVFARQFATILEAGVTVVPAMDMLKLQTTNRVLRKALEAVFEDLQKGRSLSQSLQSAGNIFPQLFINMVEAGELSGTLEDTLLRMAVHYEKESSINQKVKTAMTYPAILMAVSAAVVILMVYFILPSFMMLIETYETDIPLLTKAVINFTEFVRMKWYDILLACIVLAVIFRYLISRGKGRIMYHRFLLRMPIIGRVIKKIIASKFTRTLGILQASGISLISSLESVKNIVENGVAEEAIEQAIAAVKNGQRLAAPFEASDVFEPTVVKMIHIGEETGSLDEILIKTADYFDSEVEAGLSRLIQLIEPAMLIIMGIIVGTIVVAMLLPLYGMLNNMGI